MNERKHADMNTNSADSSATRPRLSQLIDAHPLLFRGRPPAVPGHLPAGWFELVDQLCSDLVSVLGPSGCADFEVLQIKEKFGGLRFYYRLTPPELPSLTEPTSGSDEHFETAARQARDLIKTACAASETRCEMCGQSGQLQMQGDCWKTLCARHAAERAAQAPSFREF